jgi:hypothetical protein
MLKTPYRWERRWDDFLNGPIFATAAVVFVIAAVPAFLLAALAQAVPGVGWLAISLALTIALMMRRPRG